jgi:hypothetical protein
VLERRLNSPSIRFCKRFAVDLDDPGGGDLHAPTQLATDGSTNLAREGKEQGNKQLMCGGGRL